MKLLTLLFAFAFLGCSSTVTVEQEQTCGSAVFETDADYTLMCNSSAALYQQVSDCACYDNSKIINECSGFCAGESPSPDCLNKLFTTCFGVFMPCLADTCLPGETD